MPSVASEASVFLQRPHHSSRVTPAHGDGRDHASPFSMMLDDNDPEPAPRTGPTRVERTEQPAESAEAAPVTDDQPSAPSDAAPADGAAGKQDDGSTSETTQTATGDGDDDVTAELPAIPAEASEDGDAEAAVITAQIPAQVNQPAPAVPVQPAVQVVTGVTPPEGTQRPAALDAIQTVAPQGEAKAPVPAGATPADIPAAQPAAGGAETGATIPVIKASAGQSEDKAQTKPANIEPAALAPEQQPQDNKKAEAPALPQPVKPQAAAKPQTPNEALKADLAQFAASDTDVKHHSDQVQTPTLPTSHMHAAQNAGATGAAASAQQQTPLVPVVGLAVEIAAQARAGKNRFEIRLDPPELGRIDVRLDIDKEGNVTSRLVVERAETLDLLRRDAHALERALNQAGLKTSDNSLQFSLRDQGANQQNGNEQQRGERLIVADEDHSGAQPVRGYGRLLGLGNGLDIRV